MKKSWLKLALAVVLAALMLAGCAGNGGTNGSPSGSASVTPSSSTAPSASDSDTPAASPSDTGSPPPADTGSPSPADTGTPASPADPDKTEIVIGASRPISGVYQVFQESVFGPMYKMWVQEVNDAGGIYVEEYGKKLPIRMIEYDDTSDLATMTRLTERLMLEDKVDFMFPSTSTAILFAQAKITSDNGYMMFGCEGGAAELSKSYEDFPLFFSAGSHSATQMPALAELLPTLGVESAYIMYIEDLHGFEYSAAAEEILPAAGIEILGMQAVPPNIADLTPVLTEAMNSGADAFLSFCYPDQNFPAVGVAQSIGYNPDVFLIGPGGSMQAFADGIAPGPISEGVMAFGAWNAKSSPETAAFVEKFKTFYPEIGLEWWGHISNYAILEIFQQAIEGAGTLDNQAVADYMKNNHFQTVMGEVWFENNSIADECWLGNIGQWQNGIFEVIDADPARRTAEPIYPKPAWP